MVKELNEEQSEELNREQSEELNREQSEELNEEQLEELNEERSEGLNGKEPSLVLEKAVITLPLFELFEKTKLKNEKIQKETGKKPEEPVYSVIIDVNLFYYEGREAAKNKVQDMVIEILHDGSPKKATDPQGINPLKTRFSQQYVFAKLEEKVIRELVKRDSLEKKGQAIYHIWCDFEIKKLTTKSISTVKADAARNAFSALGERIYWAVLDSGIDETHPQFIMHKNLELPKIPDPLQHRDFTILNDLADTHENLKQDIGFTPNENEKPLIDELGHGTHVAGIIAGELKAANNQTIIATTLFRDENRKVKKKEIPVETGISGMASKCKLVSVKVLDKDGRGEASNLIAAIQWIQEINSNGRNIRIHGVNMSVGYEFEPLWFACGQSPLCVEVNRLVKSGVVVVVSAGNTGYGFVQAQGKRAAVTAGLDLTINDPGNADFAITVGSTHRDMPHVYGVSYFSSKGPTGDGTLKPDLVAPGEKIISCDSSQRRANDPETKNSSMASDVNSEKNSKGSENKSPPPGYYREDSGTSMAAPHVSGVIAAFLSVRREFIGQPEVVKEIFLSTATDLKRERYFQGHGLVDLMRAMQSV